MKIKNTVSIALITLLVFSCIIPSNSIASSDENLKIVIEKTKEILNIGEEYDKFDYSLNKDGEITLYNLDWQDSDETKFISVTIDSEGLITNYDKRSREDANQSKIPKISEEEGRKISEDFIKKINPNIKENIEYSGKDSSADGYMNRYYFNLFIRTENGIPYISNKASVNVDKITGEVKNFYVIWDRDLNFPNNKDIISKEEADEIYKEKVKFELMYKYSFVDKEKKPTLVYSLVDKNKSIDAKTGELIDYSNNYDNIAQSKIMDKEYNKVSQLTQEELEAIKNTKEIINESQAETIARQFAEIDDSYKLYQLNLSKESDGYNWYLNFDKNEKDNYGSIHVAVNAKTKEVLYFSKYSRDDEKKESKYDREQSLKIAEEFLNKTQKEKSKQVESIEVPTSKDLYSFKFMRKVNGILFDGDGFNITIDSTNGQIVEYTTSWYDKKLPGIENLVSKEQAYKTFFDKAKLELQYTKIIDDDEIKDTMLVYLLKDAENLDIDAKTGKIINLYSQLENDIQNKPIYKDIEKSIAKNHIETLLNMNIYLPGENFKPKGQITQRDFLYLLCRSKENYVKYEEVDELYRILIGQGIVKREEKSPESKINREEAVKYIIRSLGHSKIAELDSIYSLNFKDSEKIDPKLKGHIAIAKGLGIINGSSTGEFKPKEKLTREQAIIMIYNTLDAKN